MENHRLFRCKLTNSWIQYEIEDSVADMKTFNFEFQNIKPFFSLVRDSIDTLKNQGISKIRQMVTYDDYNNFLKDKTKWNLVFDDKMHDCYLLECPIDDFIFNFSKGHGL